MADYDLIIIGSGPGGYVAAVRAAQLGLKTACVEKEQRLGGVCLNVGCIPSKALLDSSEYYHLARTHLADHGILADGIRLDLPTMMARKDKVVGELTHNVRQLLESHKIDIISGTGSLEGSGKVAIASDKGETKRIEADNILLAAGSAGLLARQSLLHRAAAPDDRSRLQGALAGVDPAGYEYRSYPDFGGADAHIPAQKCAMAVGCSSGGFFQKRLLHPR